jgi:hypothetical protein
VKLTELVPQPVNVLMDTMNHKMNALVKNVLTGVIPVLMISIVSSVLETESNSHSVLVNQVLGMMVLLGVNLVVTDVIPVKDPLITVPTVKESEPQNQIAHVQILIMKKKTDNVNFAQSNVNLVSTTKTIVKSVEMIDIKSQTVHVYQVPLKFQILMN